MSDNQEVELKPIIKNCKGCGEKFTISIRDQQFLKDQVAKGVWPNYSEPVRCLNCRKKRRQESSQTKS